MITYILYWVVLFLLFRSICSEYVVMKAQWFHLSASELLNIVKNKVFVHGLCITFMVLVYDLVYKNFMMVG